MTHPETLAIKPAYPESSLGGYALGMIMLLIDSLHSPSVWLWLVVTVVAVLLLAGSAGRRRVSLVETLREFVARNQDPPAAKKTPAVDPDDAGPAS